MNESTNLFYDQGKWDQKLKKWKIISFLFIPEDLMGENDQ